MDVAHEDAFLNLLASGFAIAMILVASRFAAAQSTQALPVPPLPVRQAETIGMGKCVPVLERMSRVALTSPYDAQSGWSRDDPARHIFQSVAALTRPGNVPSDGMVALVAAPLAGGSCDGVAVQMFPLAGDCRRAQKLILRGGETVAPLLGTRIMRDAAGHRLFLLPGFADTCIAVAVDTFVGSP
jgi:hypothetical protein